MLITVDGPWIRDQTTIAHFRIDTIDNVTLMPRVVGTSSLKLFVSPVSQCESQCVCECESVSM